MTDEYEHFANGTKLLMTPEEKAWVPLFDKWLATRTVTSERDAFHAGWEARGEMDAAPPTRPA